MARSAWREAHGAHLFLLDQACDEAQAANLDLRLQAVRVDACSLVAGQQDVLHIRAHVLAMKASNGMCLMEPGSACASETTPLARLKHHDCDKQRTGHV